MLYGFKELTNYGSSTPSIFYVVCFSPFLCDCSEIKFAFSIFASVYLLLFYCLQITGLVSTIFLCLPMILVLVHKILLLCGILNSDPLFHP